MAYYARKNTRQSDLAPADLSTRELWERGIEASKKLYKASTEPDPASITQKNIIISQCYDGGRSP